jgi:3-hydroxyisobutyrate dehydrogenase-like beta-hydroxyacid dehydrogenase
MTSVGVIGLGLIGSALAHRLTRTGDAPLVFDVNPKALEGAVAAGAIAAVPLP